MAFLKQWLFKLRLCCDCDPLLEGEQEALTLQRGLQRQGQQAGNDDVMEAPRRFFCVFRLLRYSLEAATRQHHLLHRKTYATWNNTQQQ